MKIQFAITEYLPDVFGGAEVYTSNLASELKNRGHDVSILSPGIVRKNTRVEDEEYNNIPVHRLAFVPHTISPALYAIRFYIELYDEAIAWFKKSRPDVVHITNAWFMAPVAFAACKCGIPVIGTHVDFVWSCKESHLLNQAGKVCTKWRGQTCRKCFPDLTEAEWKFAQQMRKRMHQLLAQSYQFHHCPSPILAEQIRSLDVPNHKIGIWPYGVPDDLAKRRLPKTRSKKLRLAFIGRWNRIKGINILLNAMKLLSSSKDIELTLYGEKEAWNRDTYAQKIKAKADRLSNVHIAGRFNPDQLAELYQNIDCIITPSIWPENSPVSILESLALGTPVICADGVGMTNLINHKQNGLWFQSRNVASLAYAIREFSALRKKLTANCLRTISSDARYFEKIYMGVKPVSKDLSGEMDRFVRLLHRKESTVDERLKYWANRTKKARSESGLEVAISIA